MLTQIGARKPSRYLQNGPSDFILRQIKGTFAEAKEKAANVVIFFLGHGDNDGNWLLKDRPLSVREIIASWSVSPAARLAIVSDCCYAGKQIECLIKSKRDDVCLLMSSAPDEVRSVRLSILRESALLLSYLCLTSFSQRIGTSLKRLRHCKAPVKAPFSQTPSLEPAEFTSTPFGSGAFQPTSSTHYFMRTKSRKPTPP
jgi:hypothetical protein